MVRKQITQNENKTKKKYPKPTKFHSTATKFYVLRHKTSQTSKQSLMWCGYNMTWGTSDWYDELEGK